jgi:hypothetical protein
MMLPKKAIVATLFAFMKHMFNVSAMEGFCLPAMTRVRISQINDAFKASSENQPVT